MIRKNKKGFTLIETMIVALIFFVAIFALGALFASCLALITQSREIDIATNDIKNVMEKMRSLAFPQITVSFPDGAAVPGAYLLRNEVVTVTYPSASVNLLEIRVRARWTGRDQQAHEQAFKTMIYKGL